MPLSHNFLIIWRLPDFAFHTVLCAAIFSALKCGKRHPGVRSPSTVSRGCLPRLFDFHSRFDHDLVHMGVNRCAYKRSFFTQPATLISVLIFSFLFFPIWKDCLTCFDLHIDKDADQPQTWRLLIIATRAKRVSETTRIITSAQIRSVIFPFDSQSQLITRVL
jgi:hypothetical protein